MMVSDIIKNILTEKDGQSWCPIRIAFIGGVVLYFWGTAESITNFSDHARDWAAGMKDILLGGIAVAAKAFTENDGKGGE